MDRFADLKSFVAVAEAGSLSAAARRSGTTKSVVSRRLRDLEARLGARLVNRNARGLTLTEAGDRLYQRAVQLLADLEEAEQEALHENVDVRGIVRLAAPMTFGTMYLSDALLDFAADHPGISYDLDLDDRMADLATGGYDLAIRIGRLPDSSLYARKLAPSRHVVCASPDYIARHGAPSHPDELKDHGCLLYSNRDPNPAWSLTTDRIVRSYRVQAALRSNNGEILRDAALAGRGVGLLPTFIASPAIARGELEPLLPDHPPPEGTISAVYTAPRHLSSKVRLLIEHLDARFRTAPWDRSEGQSGTGIHPEQGNFSLAKSTIKP